MWKYFLIVITSLGFFCVSGLAPASELGEAVNGRLPTPKGLERDVRFWERIFSEFTPDQCVIHDTWHLDIIYAVKRVPDGDSRRRQKLVKGYLRQVRQALTGLGSRGRPANALERKVFSAVPAKHRNRAFFREAAERVRCQRGVDLQPSLARSTRYMPMIKRVLRNQNLPSDLAYLPHLESGFNRYAKSHAGAVGLWQFMPQTARGEGLRVTRTKDYRHHPEKSTLAAAAHIRSIHQRTGSWPLTITAYNYGHNGVSRAIKKFGPDYMLIRRFHKTRIFGFAARNYYPSFLAARNMAVQEEMADRKLLRKSSSRLADSRESGRPPKGG